MAEASKALTVKEETVDRILMKVQNFQRNGELDLPPNYSPGNALKSAWLILQQTTDKDKRPVLSVCSRESIANTLLDMVVQGLNPAKKQCYFIAYGQTLALHRSYFGTMAVLKQVDSRVDGPIAEVVYEGDKFAYRLNRGKKEITCHEQSLDNVDAKRIKAAYCVIYGIDGNPIYTEIMTLSEIHQAWKQSRQNPFENGEVKSGSVHGKFTAEMAKKTVTNRACKRLINSSDDEGLMLQAVRRSDEDRVVAQVEDEIAENANTGPIVDVETVEDETPSIPPEQVPSGVNGSGQTQTAQPDF